MPFARIEGGDIHYEERGGGAALAMLLPQSAGPVGVNPFVDRLAARFRVIRYDQRGTGQSAPVAGPEGMTMAGRAAEFGALLDALGIDRTHLFCHSTGCGIGLAYAASRPDRVAGLVLANPWSHGDAHLATMQRLRVAAAQALDAYRYAWFNASLLFRPTTGARMPKRSRSRQTPPRRRTPRGSRPGWRRSWLLTPARSRRASPALPWSRPRPTTS